MERWRCAGVDEGGEESKASGEASPEQKRGLLSSVAGILRRAEASGTAHGLQIAESITAASRGPKR